MTKIILFSYFNYSQV